MNKQFKRGLIVGKFCPLHRGHEHAIQRMIVDCDESFIISYTNPEFPGCEPAKRRRWLSSLYPGSRILVLDDDSIPPNDADDLTQRRFVGRLCVERFNTTVDAVFTSENYGEGFAQELSQMFGHEVKHVCVDPQRLAHPVSGTLLREHIHEHRGAVSPVVYADFVQRVCLLGGESSGKSTLAAALAQHFQTKHVAEFGRELWKQQNGHLSYGDLLNIARTQVAREVSAGEQANRFLFCDTLPLTTLFYSQSMFGKAEPELHELADRDYMLHVLCAPDFPFVQDGTRRDAAFRAEQHQWYRDQLHQRDLPWLEVHGSVSDRITHVTAALAITSPSPRHRG